MWSVQRLALHCRLLHTASTLCTAETAATTKPASAATKPVISELRKLRNKTGFSITKCKNALQKFGDFKQAETWLREQAQKEGWAKAGKLQDRNMTQGLIGMCTDGNKAAMVEVNCETDFVAKNPKFQALVSQAVKLCLSTKTNPNEPLYMKCKQINQLSTNAQGRTLADLVALEIGQIGENMLVKRGCVVEAAEGQTIGMYSHSAEPQQGKTLLGKYGALVLYTAAKQQQQGLGHNLAMHIVGMNPLTIGEMPAPETTQEDTEDTNTNDPENPKPKKKKKKKAKKTADVEKTELLQQKYLSDERLTISELLSENAATVQSFVRYQCGEQLPEEE